MKQAVFSSRTADKFVIRLPEGMRDRIAEVARHHHRSMNSEIVARLEQSLFPDRLFEVRQPPELSANGALLTAPELELLQQFRQLSHRQQNALIALIAQDTGVSLSSMGGGLSTGENTPSSSREPRPVRVL